MTTVRDVMATDVVTVTSTQPITEVADVLAAHKISAVPVLDDSGTLIGLLDDDDLILSETNIHVPTVVSFLDADFVLPGALHKFEKEMRKVAGSTAGDVMDTDYATANPADEIEKVATLMHDKKQTHVPVLENGKLVGIVARGDLVRHLAATT